MHNEIKAGQRKNRYGFWYGWTIMGSILERKKVAGMVGVVVQMATRECLCLVPALIDSNSAMLEARPHPSHQWASGFARNARLAKPSEWARGSVRIRHSVCSHQPSSFVPSPTLLAFILGKMHTNAIFPVAVRRRPRL